MKKRPEAFFEVYRDSVPVQKLKAGARRVVVFDKDGTIQCFPHPVPIPSEREIVAGKEIRRITNEYPTGHSSAQVLELGVDRELYQASVACGYNRPPPNIRLPDGSITSDPAEVDGWEYLLNPDFFLGFGSGIYARKNGAYVSDTEYRLAIEGPAWRDRVFGDLDFLYPDKSYQQHLGLVDREGLYEKGGVDVAPLEYRIQFDHYGAEGMEARDRMYLEVAAAQLRGRFSNVALVDESNPRKDRYTTYLVDSYWKKEVMLERFGNRLSYHAGVPMEELEFIKVGDSPTDLASGLEAFQGAARVTLILAGKSRLNECIRYNLGAFAGRPFVGGPNHPELPGRYQATDTPGVYWWKGEHLQPRRVILAEYAPWSRGLECTESVLACLHQLGFK